MRTQDKVCVSFIHGGDVSGAFASDLMHVGMVLRDKIDGIVQVEGHLLSRQRNQVVSEFFRRSNAPWLLMLDTDHRISPQALTALFDLAHDKAAPVVSALYFGAFPSVDGLLPNPVPIAFAKDASGEYRAIADWDRSKPIAVDAVGAGCLLVHRDVLSAVREHVGLGDWSWFADEPRADGKWYSEDVVFCERVRATGHRILVHPSVELPHLKSYWLSGDHYRVQTATRVPSENAARPKPELRSA